MRADDRLPPRAAVYVASGVRDELLGGVMSLFDVRRRPSRPSHQGTLVSYEDALVDREVCRHATLPLFAHEMSTFSMSLARLRDAPVVWYNKA